MVPSPRPGVRGRALVVVLCFVVFVASRPSFAQTGDDWRISNIGAPVLAGSASIQCQSAAACAMNVTAAGADIGGISDQFTFAYFTFTGDGAFVARVDSLVNTDDAAAAGLMVRESLRAGSKHALALVSAVKTPVFQRRLATDGITLNTGGLQAPSRVWLKLERVGAIFSAYQSADGTTWTRYANDTIDMPATVLVGLAVTSHNPALRTTARFSRIGVTPLLPNE